MIQENLLLIAIVVFVLMLVGLILTVVELNYGEPKRQIKQQSAAEYPER
jgi:hypothetical protein